MATRFVKFLDAHDEPCWVNPDQVIRVVRDSRTGFASLDMADGSAWDTQVSVEEALRRLQG